MARSQKHPFFPDASFRFDETSILMFRTNMLNYEFVAAMNQACDLQLARVEDIPIEGARYPCFSMYAPDSRLAFVVIDRPAQDNYNPCMGYYDKLLLVNGRDAFDFQRQLYDAVTTARPEPAQTDLLGHMQWQQMNDLAEGIFTVDTFCLDERRGISTSMHNGPVETMSKSTLAFMNKLRKFITATFETLEWHLCEDCWE